MKIQSWKNGEFVCNTDKSKLRTDLIHQFLSERSYWAKGRTMDKVERSMEHSLCFGVYQCEQQVAFGRVVTDFTVYAYLLGSTGNLVKSLQLA
jgi:hypothetical protein